jgi:hypothetical protein
MGSLYLVVRPCLKVQDDISGLRMGLAREGDFLLCVRVNGLAGLRTNSAKNNSCVSYGLSPRVRRRLFITSEFLDDPPAAQPSSVSAARKAA